MVKFDPSDLEGNEITDQDLGHPAYTDEQLFSAQQFFTAMDYLAEMVGGPEIAVAYAMTPQRLHKLQTAAKLNSFQITTHDSDLLRLPRYMGIPIMSHPELSDNEVYCWRGRNRGKHWIAHWITEKY